MKLLNFLVHFALFTLLFSCGQHRENDQKIVSSHAFFENSKRELFYSNHIEAKGLARVNGCTGFFIHNAQNKNILVSARHCFGFQATNWCLNGGLAKVEYTGDILQCREVIAGDANHDIVVLRFEDNIRDRSKDFILGTFDLESDDRLAMYGFPADPFNVGNHLALTENCWVKMAFSFNSYREDENNKANKTFTHNCSTYGGNSGGPMVLEGTRIVVGLPNAYFPNRFENRPETHSVEGISMAKYINVFKSDLDRFHIFYQEFKITNEKNFFTSGLFQSILNPGCFLEIKKVAYNTNAFPSYLRLEFTNLSCGQGMDLVCHNNGQCFFNNELKVQLNHENSFQLFENNSIYNYIRISN